MPSATVHWHRMKRSSLHTVCVWLLPGTTKSAMCKQDWEWPTS